MPDEPGAVSVRGRQLGPTPGAMAPGTLHCLATDFAMPEAVNPNAASTSPSSLHCHSTYFSAGTCRASPPETSALWSPLRWREGSSPTAVGAPERSCRQPHRYHPHGNHGSRYTIVGLSGTCTWLEAADCRVRADRFFNQRRRGRFHQSPADHPPSSRRFNSVPEVIRLSLTLQVPMPNIHSCMYSHMTIQVSFPTTPSCGFAVMT